MEQVTRPRLQIRVEQAGVQPLTYTSTDAFRIGRGVECELRIDSGLVSRVHAEVVFEDGFWWMRDLGSTNGLYVGDEKVSRVRLQDQTTIELGHNAPILHASIAPAAGLPADAVASPPSSSARPEAPVAATLRHKTARPTLSASDAPPSASASSAAPPSTPDASLSHIIQRYFEADSDEPAGDHTMMIRRAYSRVKQKQHRKYSWIIAGVLALSVMAFGFWIYERLESNKLRRNIADMFYDLKQTDLDIAELLAGWEDSQNTTLLETLRGIRARRDEQAARYDGLVIELGLYRRLSEEEQLIYKMARIFNESQVDIPAGFIREVKAKIQEAWLTPGGRHTYTQSIERARNNGYIPYIVQAFEQHGLPPQFFYLALQESNYKVNALGWLDHPRFGRAKGMWQFIPETARGYGLFVPEFDQNANRVVPGDERHDFEKSTRAAADYLQYIYTTLAQASGLLAMASYNWGEGRVIKRLNQLPGLENIDETAVPETPRARSYWNFLTNYEAQMPEQTKDYVLKIFAAAVIGENPRYYNFDFDNPLKPYLEASASP